MKTKKRHQDAWLYRFTAAMTDSQAILMNFLLDMAQDQTELVSVEFPCSIQDIRRALHWTKTKQNEVLQALKKKGYITTQRKGMPPKRYITIDAHFLYLDVAEQRSKWLEENDGGDDS